MWEFLSHFTDTAAGQIAVFVLLAIAVAAVIQFVRGDWKIVKTKDGKVIFTTAQQRSSYDAAKTSAKDMAELIRKHVEQDEQKFTLFGRDKEKTDAMILNRLDRLEAGLIDKNDMLDWRLDLLKLMFYSDEIRRIRPCEALRAGIKYIKAGGNGEVKEDVLVYCKEHGDLYRSLQAASADYRLEELRLGVDV